MKTLTLVIAVFLTSPRAQADFSYSTTRKTTGGASVAGNNNQPSRYSFKGRKIKVETADTSIIVDLGAQTITTLNKNKRTFAVAAYNGVGSSPTVTQPGVAAPNVEVKETGRQKTIAGRRAREIVLTTNLDSPELQTMGSRLQMEMDAWISQDLPGGSELLRLYGSGFPWDSVGSALVGEGNPAMQAGLASLQRRIAAMKGVQVLEIVKVRPVANQPVKPLTPAESGHIRDTIAELDAKVQQGGPDTAAAAQELSRLKAMVGDDFLTGTLFEITMESSGFSANSIPDSEFAVPADYRAAAGR